MRSIRNVLVVQPYGLGDALFMTPFLRALRTLPTVETVDLLLGSRTEPVFRNNPHVDRIFSIDKGKWQKVSPKVVTQDLLKLTREFRGRYDLMVDFSLQREYGFYGLLWGIPRRIGFDFNGRGFALTHRLSLPEGFGGRHKVDFYCEAGKLISLQIEDRFLEFYVSEDDREEAKRVTTSNRYVALAPGGGASWGKDAVLKRWPVAYFIELLRQIRAKVDFDEVLILGDREERGLGEEIVRTFQHGSNLCGQLSIGGSAAVLERAQLFVGNDGGLVHLACALDVPTVAFYGPADPKVYGPYPPSPRREAVYRVDLPCRPCYRRFRYNAACIDRECLTGMPPEAVMVFLDRHGFWK